MNRFFAIIAIILALSAQAWGAFSITDTVPGFRLKYYLSGHERIVPTAGAAATAYTAGQPVVLSATTNLLSAAANGGSNIYGIVLKAVTTPAVTSSSTDHLVVVETNLDSVWEVNLDAASWLDDAAASAVAADGTSIAFGTGLTYGNAALDNSLHGHALVCYSGPGKGEWRYIIAYDAAGGATGDQMVSVNRPFATLPTTSSYFIILGTGSAGEGLVPGHATDLGSTSASKVKGSDGAGALVVHSLANAYKGVIEVRITDNIWSAP